jgi:DNA-binding response OmpR family regulator
VRVLLVEDDAGVAGALATALRRHGWELVCVDTGREAIRRSASADIVLLDLGLPDIDGMQVCRAVRADSGVPNIAITARGDPRSRVAGLRGGADDYVVKPFAFAELEARMEAVLRRARAERAGRPARGGTPGGGPADTLPEPDTVDVGPVRVDLARRTVTAGGLPVVLTRKEFDLLALLAERPGEVRTREEILARVWRTTWRGSSRTIDVHVATLRGKLGRPGLVETVRGIGYRLRVDVDDG